MWDRLIEKSKVGRAGLSVASGRAIHSDLGVEWKNTYLEKVTPGLCPKGRVEGKVI